MHRFASALAGLPLLFSLALCPVTAHASQILYNEATQGDLPSPYTYLDVGTTVVGYNYVNGSAEHDQDAFTFTVPTGQLLTSVFLSAKNDGGNATVFLGPGNSVFNDRIFAQIVNTIDVNLLVDQGGFERPLDPGLYNVVVNAQEGEVEYYELSFLTRSTTPPAVTPEPASLVLLSTGLLGVAGVLRKRVG